MAVSDRLTADACRALGCADGFVQRRIAGGKERDAKNRRDTERAPS